MVSLSNYTLFLDFQKKTLAFYGFYEIVLDGKKQQIFEKKISI